MINRKEIQERRIKISRKIDLKALSWTGAAYFVMVFIGLSLAVFAAHYLVESASDIAYEMKCAALAHRHSSFRIGHFFAGVDYRIDGCKA